MNRLEIGDIVKVTDWGKNYSGYKDFFIKFDIKKEYAIRYAFGNSTFYNNCRYNDSNYYEILDIRQDDYGYLCLITNSTEGGQVYLIRSDVLRVYGKSGKVREMTVKEIEEELGYLIKIIGE